MIKLIDILREAKQVGDIYHYTRLSRRFGIYDILKSGELKPAPDRAKYKGYVSFSRDRALGATLGMRAQVRITIDGDKLSNKYKILPYVQLEPETPYDKENWNSPFTRSSGSSESELVISANKYGGSVKILPYIKKIDIIADESDRSIIYIKGLIELEEMCKQLNIPIKFHAQEGYDDEGYWSPSKYTRALKSQFYDNKFNDDWSPSKQQFNDDWSHKF
jgi:hypothetical protein